MKTFVNKHHLHTSSELCKYLNSQLLLHHHLNVSILAMDTESNNIFDPLCTQDLAASNYEVFYSLEGCSQSTTQSYTVTIHLPWLLNKGVMQCTHLHISHGTVVLSWTCFMLIILLSFPFLFLLVLVSISPCVLMEPSTLLTLIHDYSSDGSVILSDSILLCSSKSLLPLVGIISSHHRSTYVIDVYLYYIVYLYILWFPSQVLVNTPSSLTHHPQPP